MSETVLKIAPSILSADYSKLGDEIRRAENSGADWIHVDVMDGHFVPNLSIGPAVVRSIRKTTELPFDCHLMVSRPFDYIDSFASSGADLISFHIESESDPERTIAKIKSAGKKPALALKPATKAESVFPFLGEVDMVLVMTVEPGFGGQSFMPEMLPKIKKLRAELQRIGSNADIEVDGGIDRDTAWLCREAGANVFVSGSFLFGASDMAKATALLR